MTSMNALPLPGQPLQLLRAVQFPWKSFPAGAILHLAGVLPAPGGALVRTSDGDLGVLPDHSWTRLRPFDLFDFDIGAKVCVLRPSSRHRFPSGAVAVVYARRFAPFHDGKHLLALKFPGERSLDHPSDRRDWLRAAEENLVLLDADNDIS
jgi:hypothetical protein